MNCNVLLETGGNTIFDVYKISPPREESINELLWSRPPNEPIPTEAEIDAKDDDVDEWEVKR
jgi:hypothetical protein